MRLDIISILPNAFGYFRESILGRALAKRKITVKIHDLRRWTTDRHRTVDDRPYGGGPGMVLKVEPIAKAIAAVRKKKGKTRVILFAAKGKPFTQSLVRRWATYDQLVLVAGRYEGVDERVLDFVDEEISIGDYVLTGGELPAMVVVDAVSRLIPGVLGKSASLSQESHGRTGALEYPHYTRPEVFRGKRVPKVLLSGNPARIEAWQKRMSRRRR